MPPDIRNAESAFARGGTQFDIFLRNFEREWNRPLAQMQIAMLLGRQPREVIETIPGDALERLSGALDMELFDEEAPDAVAEV